MLAELLAELLAAIQIGHKLVPKRFFPACGEGKSAHEIKPLFVKYKEFNHI